jgi:hypothetical protein
MATTTLKINIPKNEEIKQRIKQYTPEELEALLKLGMDLYDKHFKNIYKHEKPKKKYLSDSLSIEQQKIILEMYKDRQINILDIQSYTNISPSLITSLLQKYRIITDRKDARGYDIYRTTEEYKKRSEELAKKLKK